MGCIIIVMSKIEDTRKLGSLLIKRGLRPDLLCTSAAEALSESSRRDGGFVICGSCLPDMGFLEFRDCLPKSFRLVILSKNIMSDDYPVDSIKLSLPLRIVDLISVLDKEPGVYADQRQEKQSPRSTRSIEEKRYIDKAKLLLMDRKGMSEPEAYRYIQKSSMDNSYTMVETAQMILLMNS